MRKLPQGECRRKRYCSEVQDCTHLSNAHGARPAATAAVLQTAGPLTPASNRAQTTPEESNVSSPGQVARSRVTQPRGHGPHLFLRTPEGFNREAGPVRPRSGVGMFWCGRRSTGFARGYSNWTPFRGPGPAGILCLHAASNVRMTVGGGPTPEKAGAAGYGYRISVIREIRGQEVRIRQGFQLDRVPGSSLKGQRLGNTPWPLVLPNG